MDYKKLANDVIQKLHLLSEINDLLKDVELKHDKFFLATIMENIYNWWIIEYSVIWSISSLYPDDKKEISKYIKRQKEFKELNVRDYIIDVYKLYWEHSA